MKFKKKIQMSELMMQLCKASQEAMNISIEFI